ncbi:MAG: hypothetical protein BIP78_0046 [Candidatus Bipolaricaulis sibiricus]|uniref:Uncharacterized protein n=1 Tax=Bipolaricaulis sibiricus TaxID=2501609 RepID=A0A410FS59_BIPS1|nr:MAG: hypothetical protein BIP78_0046 [Candidatus Bipolaricaulis sibiricus]
MKRALAFLVVGLTLSTVVALAGGDQNMKQNLSEPGQGATVVGTNNQGDADQSRSGVTW